MNQKTIKGYKREISETSAANFGYYPDVLPAILEKINGDMIFEIMSDGMGDYLNQLARHNKSAEFHNVLVTEAIQKMNYQEFKEIMPYFFSYHRDQEEIVTETIPVNRAWYDKLQANYKKGQAQQISSLNKRLKAIEYDMKRNETQVLGVNPVTEEILSLDNGNYYMELPDSDILLNRPMDSRGGTDISQIMKTLYERHPDVMPVVYEYVLDAQAEKAEISDTFAGWIIDHLGYEDWEMHASVAFDSQRELYDYLIDNHYLIQTTSFEEVLEAQFDTFNDYALGHFEEMSYHQISELFSGDLRVLNERIKSLDDKVQLAFHEVRGYSQDDIWTLAAAFNPEQFNEDTVINHLEHEIGAWYRGSLVNMDVHDKDGELAYSTSVDQELLWGDELTKAMRVADLEGFITRDEAVFFESIKDELSAQERADFINAVPNERKAIMEAVQQEKDHEQEENRRMNRGK